MRFFKMSQRSHRKIDHVKSESARWVMMPFHVMGLFFSSMASTISNWWSRRNLRFLLQGIPALLIFIGVVVVGVFCMSKDRSVLADEYVNAAKMSLRDSQEQIQANKDPGKSMALAQSYFNRLTYLRSDDLENRFLLAQTYQQRGALANTKARKAAEKLKNTTDAEEQANIQKEIEQLQEEEMSMRSGTLRLMSSMAPEDKRGFGRAHLWMFENLYRLERGPDGKYLPPSPMAILRAERHLLHAMEWPGADVVLGAHFGLARLYRDTGRIDDAKRHLAEVAARFPEYRLTLAQWAKMQGENELVMNHSRAAENAFRSRLTTTVDDHEARFGLVEALLLQNRFKDAQDLINLGATLSTSQDIIRAYAKKMTGLLIAWADAKEADPRSTIAERLALLDDALTLEPDNPELFSRLMKLTKDKSPEAEKAREVFRKHAIEQDKSATAQLFLGIDAYQQERPQEARYHWEKAFALSKGAPLVANNLAWAIAFYPPVDLPRALEMVNAAIERVPNEPRFKGTRGHILAKMKKYKEALPDLEDSVKVYTQDANLYRVLNETCTALGYTKMAAEYKSREEAVKGKTGASVTPLTPSDKKAETAPGDLKAPAGAPSLDKPLVPRPAPAKEEPKPGTKPPG